MRIRSLQLENIKSYTYAAVDFTSGVNAVCGLNGSGKTTILEAIGSALFDYLPYNQQAFLREGEKSGTIRVRIVARDGREYEVVRKIGSSGAYHVTDVETNTRLAERGENVLDWIGSQALGIDGGGDLKAMFKDAVGVPQGAMTVDFLKPASQRKTVFDPLLRVQEYGDAVVSLRDTVSHVRDLSAVKREEIAGLESKTERIPEWKEQQEQLVEQVQVSDQRLKELSDELSEAQGQSDALDAVEEQLRAALRELEMKRSDVRNFGATLAEQEKNVEASRAARRAVAESEAGYQRILEARKRLAVLEQQRKQRDALAQNLAEAQSARQDVWGGIKRLDAERLAAVEAGEQAANLVNQVARQGELEEQVQELRGQVREARQLDDQVTKARSAIDDLEQAMKAREERLAAARAAGKEAEKLAEVEEQLNPIRERLASMPQVRERLEASKAEGRRVRKQHDELAEEVRLRDDLVQQSEELRSEAEELDALLARQQELREERARVAATIEYQNVARADLRNRQCPLLELECPVVATDAGTLDRFDDRLAVLRSRSKELEAELRALDRRVETARSTNDKLQELELKIAQLDKSGTRLEAVEQELERCRKEYAELAQVLAGEGELMSAREALEGELRRLRKLTEEVARLPLLEEQREQDLRRLQLLGEDLAGLESRRKALAGVEERTGALQRELDALDGPRGKQQGLLAIAQRKASLEAQLEQEQERLNEEAGRVKALSAELATFRSLDAEFDEVRAIEQQYGPDYDRYKENQENARRLEERERCVVATKGQLEAAQIAEHEAQQWLEETAAAYDVERHQTLKLRCRELGEQMAAESQTNGHLLKQLAIVEEELAYLRRQEEKLLACRKELDELQQIGKAVAFIRETIKAAGPAITESLLTNISQMANDIYAEIMDDHAAELRWDRDYEILVQRGAESRTFAQLSGGEQMSAALSVRLALLKEMSEVDFAFFDEPTQNMDVDRRANLADQIRAVRGFDQLIVISHDDTFEHHTDNLIRLRKVNEETEVEVA
jgi:exonuclease SbcC